MNFEITITPFFASPLASPCRRSIRSTIFIEFSSTLVRPADNVLFFLRLFLSSFLHSPSKLFIGLLFYLGAVLFLRRISPLVRYACAPASTRGDFLARVSRLHLLSPSSSLRGYPFSSLSSASPTMLLLPLRNNFYLLLLTRSVSVFLSLCPSFFLCFSFSLLFPTLFLNPPTDRLILDLADLAFIRARLLKPLCASTSGIYRGRMTREHASHSRYRTDAKSR